MEVQERKEFFRQASQIHETNILEFKKGLPRNLRERTSRLIATFLFYNSISQDKKKQVAKEIEFAEALIEKGIPISIGYWSPIIKSGVLGATSFDHIKIISSAVLNGITEQTGYEEKFDCFYAIKEYLDYLVKFQKEHSEDYLRQADFKFKIDTKREWQFINEYASSKNWIEGRILIDDKVSWIESGKAKTLGHFIDAITQYVYNGDEDLNRLVEFPSRLQSDWRFDFATELFTINSRPVKREDLSDSRRPERRSAAIREEFRQDLKHLLMELNRKFNMDYSVESDLTYNQY